MVFLSPMEGWFCEVKGQVLAMGMGDLNAWYIKSALRVTPIRQSKLKNKLGYKKSTGVC